MTRPHRGAGDSRDDAGFAMMMVLISMSVMMLFITVSVSTIVATSVPSRGDQDDKAATAAAQAGIEEYLGRLSGDPVYWLKNNVDSTNAAFGATGRTLPTLTGGARFRYRVLNTTAAIDATGLIELESTGTSSAGNGGRTLTRVLRAKLQRNGATGSWSPNYAYFSDREVGDPAQFGAYSTNSKCGAYYYGTTAGVAGTGRSTVAGNSTACPEIPWLSGDSVTGQVYSNDAQYIAGNATFSVKPKSAWAAGSSGKWYWGSGTPTNTPQTAPALSNLPTDNTYLKSIVTSVGCTYKGATRITFSGTQMTVYSPATTTSVAGCFNAANATNAQTFTTPSLIYVQSAASGTCPSLGYPAATEFTGGTYLDSTGGKQYTPDYSCTRGTAYVSGTVNGAVTVGTENDIVIGGDLTVASTSGTNMIGLQANEDVWVYHPVKQTGSTIVTGPTTQTKVSSCTGGTTTSGGTTTVVTCSSQYCISYFIFLCTGYGYDKNTTVTTTTAAYANLLATPVLNIQASILADSFVVQNFNRGAAISTAPSTNRLTLYGSLSQQFRGPMAAIASSTYSTGYLANYTFDSRLTTLLPPYFVDPGLSTWKAVLVTDG